MAGTVIKMAVGAFFIFRCSFGKTMLHTKFEKNKVLQCYFLENCINFVKKSAISSRLFGFEQRRIGPTEHRLTAELRVRAGNVADLDADPRGERGERGEADAEFLQQRACAGVNVRAVLSFLLHFEASV